MSTVVNTYTGKRRQFSLGLLVLANLLPLVGVFLLDWDAGYLMLLYWCENIVLGFYTLLKILLTSTRADLPLAPFFVVHYGGFCAGHLVFIMTLLFQDADPMALAAQWQFQIMLAALFVSHGGSFLVNFLLAGERHRMTARQAMFAPYGRIVLLHVAILLGGMAAYALGQAVIMLVALIALKIALDVALHLREHRRFAGE